ncbi:MAG: hypothetical protein AB7L09_01945 [Nitrospira sp.]
MFAPNPSAPVQPHTAPVNPCLDSYQEGADGTNLLSTRDPIMAAMGLYFACREIEREAELAELKARAREKRSA